MGLGYLVIAALGLAFASGCAARDIPPDRGPSGQPRASWILRTGNGRSQTVCSSSVKQRCVVEMGTDERPQMVAVSVYLYAAGAKTTYRGWFSASFIGDTGYETNVNYEIDSEAQPTALAISGPVVSAAGAYEFRLGLVADLPERPEAHKLDFAVPVSVVRRQ